MNLKKFIPKVGNMTKQEQIEEMAKYICNVCDFKCDSFLSGRFCAVTLEAVETIYNVGYRKIDDLKDENKQLKTECALLEDELRIARRDTIDVLNKVKEKLNNMSNGWAYTTYIDDLLKEYENGK